MAFRDDILVITQNVCTTMLELDVVLAEACELPIDQEGIHGCIEISGRWRGTVILQATSQFASLAASRMLAMEQDQVVLIDCQDAISELTNMIGGNIKSLVPGPTSLSIPSISVGNRLAVGRLLGTPVHMAVDASVLFQKRMMTFAVQPLKPIQPTGPYQPTGLVNGQTSALKMAIVPQICHDQYLRVILSVDSLVRS